MSLVALTVLVGCKGKTAETETVEENSKVAVKVATAVMKPIDQIYEYSGTVEGFKVNNISPSMPLRIDKINVEVGDVVRAGQVLAIMDKTQFNQATVQLKTLEQDLKRIENLLKAGAISQQEYDNLKSQVDISTTSVNNLKENMQLTSPISGIVTARNYDDGDMYGALPVVTVMRMQPVKILVNVQETFYPSVKKGMKVKVKLDTYPDRDFEGTVYLVHPTVNQLTRTFAVEVTLPNSDMTVKPGMFARVEMTFDVIPRVAIPDKAVQKQEGSNERYVFVIKNGVAHRKSVELGRRVGDEFEVLSGVEENDQVAIAGTTRLMDKTEVEIQN
jgi:RND family efflux transporter MFP subunit